MNKYQELAIKAGISITKNTKITLTEIGEVPQWMREERARSAREIKEVEEKLRIEQGDLYIEPTRDTVQLDRMVDGYKLGHSSVFDELIVGVPFGQGEFSNAPLAKAQKALFEKRLKDYLGERKQ
jgi:hypothetical protein